MNLRVCRMNIMTSKNADVDLTEDVYYFHILCVPVQGSHERENCAVCLELYSNNDIIRILPCG